MNNPNWIKEWPMIISKNGLRSKRLSVLPDFPPEDTTKKGMKSLRILDADTRRTYQVLVTSQDIQAIIDIVSTGCNFTFNNDEPWANVELFVNFPIKTPSV